MLLFILLLPVALLVLNMVIFPKTKGFLQPLKVRVKK